MFTNMQRIEFFGLHKGMPRTRVFKSIGDSVEFVKRLHKDGIKNARMRLVVYSENEKDRRYVVSY